MTAPVPGSSHGAPRETAPRSLRRMLFRSLHPARPVPRPSSAGQAPLEPSRPAGAVPLLDEIPAPVSARAHLGASGAFASP